MRHLKFLPTVMILMIFLRRIQESYKLRELEPFSIAFLCSAHVLDMTDLEQELKMKKHREHPDF